MNSERLLSLRILKRRKRRAPLLAVSPRWEIFALLFFLAVSFARASETNSTAAASASGEEFSGGDTTVFDRSPKAFGFPARNIQDEHRPAFFVGHSFFENSWVVAPASTPDRQGLGPLFNARSCSACHAADGRSQPPKSPTDPMVTMLMRVSVPGTGSHGEPMPDPTYGGQIQGQGIPGVLPEADVCVRYEEVPGAFGNGEVFSLRRPVYTIDHPGYGPFATNAMLSPRVAPGMYGAGLLEAVPEATLRGLVERQNAFGLGIAGHLNRVWDKAGGRIACGRFGWKAEQPTVFQQVATAFNEDMGITSSLLPEENYTAAEQVCAMHPSGGHPEVSDTILNDVVLYTRTLAVPARRNCAEPLALRGQALFAEAACAVCHVPTLQTGDSDLPELAHQTIRPYTDLLLHDMGEDLADHRPVFDAGGRDWRTPPLWGIGLVSKVNGHTCFLHDGRARNFAEAILLHGGEAKTAREKFRNMSKPDREALMAFLESL